MAFDSIKTSAERRTKLKKVRSERIGPESLHAAAVTHRDESKRAVMKKSRSERIRTEARNLDVGNKPSSTQPQRDNHNSSINGKKERKSKLDKICELEATLATSKEENRILRKELYALKVQLQSDTLPLVPPFSHDGDDEKTKLKDAVRALRRVTVNQQKSLNSMRGKAAQRREELKTKDATIKSLESKVKCLQQAMNGGGLDGGASETELRLQLSEMQRGYYEKETENSILKKELEASQSKLEASISQLEASISQLDTSRSSSGQKMYDPMSGGSSNHSAQNSMMSHASLNSSFASASTAFTAAESLSASEMSDPGKLKKCLAEESNRVVKLERELEAAKEKIFDIMQKQKGSLDSSAAHRPYTASHEPDDDDSDYDSDEDDDGEGGGGGGDCDDRFQWSAIVEKVSSAREQV